MATPDKAASSVGRRAAGQGALLFSGFAAAQALSFLRNALIGHWLAKGDFGIAATLTLLLQLVETLTDLGADRLVVQAEDGDKPDFVATAHAVLVVRGLLTGVVLLLLAAPMARFFAIPDARWAFAVIALVPVVKGFLHLDARRAQRRLDNRPFLWIEVAPQAVALALAPVALTLSDDYAAIVWLSLLQAAVAVGVSHALAERRWRAALDVSVARRLVHFGWPIWASAFPLVAVYQGDRILVGHVYGMEALAGYTAAFMIAMVPGLVAAKVGHALMLPLMSDVRADARAFAARFTALSEITVLAASLYLTLFLVAGGTILPLAFGSNYTGLGPVVGWLALMWSLRMLQAVPGMALMAHGETRPFLAAGLIRAAALLPCVALAMAGQSLTTIAAAGCAGELMSLLYVAWRVDALHPRLGRRFALRTAALVPVALSAMAVARLLPESHGVLAILSAVLLLGALLIGAALVVLPALKSSLRSATTRLGPVQHSISIRP